MKKVALLSILALSGIACLYAFKNNGPLTTENRPVGEFIGIRAGGVFHINITQSDKPSVTLTAPEELCGKIKTEVKHGILEITSKGGFSADTAITLDIHFTSLNSLDCSGACILKSSSHFHSDILKIAGSGASHLSLDAEAANMIVRMDGASHLTLSGKADKLDISLEGAGELEADYLEARDCKASLSGAANASVHANHSLHANAGGASHLSYSGTPENKVTESSGAASIARSIK